MMHLSEVPYVEHLLLGTGDTLAATLDKDLVRLERLACPTLAISGRLSREGDLDTVLLLETDDILATLVDKRRVVLVGNLEDLRGLIGKTLSLSQNTTLGFLHVLLAADDLDLGL